MIDRIKSIIDYYNLSPAQFADRIGFQRSALSHVLSGRNNPSLDFVLKVKVAFPSISLDWLALGKGNQFTNKEVQPIVNEMSLGELETSHIVEKQLRLDETENVQGKMDFSQNFKEPEQQPSKSKEYQGFKEEKQIIKVILLYDDGSFSEHIPEK